MRVDNQGVQILQAKLQEALQLLEGTVIKARVIEQSQENVKLQFRNQQIDAKIQGNVGNMEGRSVSFLVVSNNTDEILLKPVPEETAQVLQGGKISQGSVNTLLRNMGLENDPKAMEIISNMMQFGMPIDEKAVSEMIMNSKNMENLLDLQQGEKVFLVRESVQDVLQNLRGQDIPKFVESALANTDSPIAKAVNLAIKSGIPSDRIAQAIMSAESPMDLAEKLRELMPEADTMRLSDKLNAQNSTADEFSGSEKSISKTPINKLMVSNDEFMGELREVSKEVKDFLPKLSNDALLNLKEDLPKMSAFFKKYEIPLNLGNMKQMLEYVHNPDSFMKDLKNLSDLIKANPEILNEEINSQDISKVLEHLSKNLSDSKVQSALERVFPNSQGFENMQQKLDFLYDINRNLNFMPFPLNAEMLKREGFINLMDENGKGKVDYKKSLNIMINVDTHYMGDVRVFCRLNHNNLKVKLAIKEEDMRFFNIGIEGLKIKIQELGYNMENIEFSFNKRLSILDLPMDPELPNYFLDMRV